MTTRIETTDDILILVFAKGSERYAFVYRDENRSELLRTLGRFAADERLGFNVFDCALLIEHITRIENGAST